jgi:glycosyltransferase involved in cell wall biosynthesis
LESNGLDVYESAARFGAYAPNSRIIRPFWLTATLVDSLARVIKTAQYDLCFLQRNLIATLNSFELLIDIPLVFDVDDSIFLTQRANSVDKIAKHASLVICGNKFLAEYFGQLSPVVVLPTAVDTDKFMPREGGLNFERKIIGWTGSSATIKYLYTIEPALSVLLKRFPDVIVKIISDRKPEFKELPVERVIFEAWNPETEVISLQDFTVGLMPLHDDLWARGKCSLKMLTYMAMRIPVVVSPVGMNVDVLKNGACGYLAYTVDDWVDAISSLLSSQSLSENMGAIGQMVIKSYYAKNIISPQLAEILRGVLKGIH